MKKGFLILSILLAAASNLFAQKVYLNPLYAKSDSEMVAITDNSTDADESYMETILGKKFRGLMEAMLERGYSPNDFSGSITEAYQAAVDSSGWLIIPGDYSTDSTVTYTTSPIIDFRNGTVTITPLSFNRDSTSTWYDSDTDTLKIDPSALAIMEYKDSSQRFWNFDSLGRLIFTDGDNDSLIFDSSALYAFLLTDNGTNLFRVDSSGSVYAAGNTHVDGTGHFVGTLSVGDSTTGDSDGTLGFADDGNLSAETLTWDDGTGTFVISDDFTVGDGEAGVDYVLKFDGETNDGTITWQEDENVFRASRFIAMPRRIDFDILAWFPPATNGATLDTVGTFEEVYAFSDDDTLYNKFVLDASYSTIDSVEIFISPQSTDGDSAAFSLYSVGKAVGETWGAFGLAGADTLDLGTTANARGRMVIYPSVGSLAAKDEVMWYIVRNGSISNNDGTDVNVERVTFYVR